MSKKEKFLSQQEEQEIVEAIRMAEKNTSGEIRVHLEKSTSMAHFDRAIEVFHDLKMNNTKLKNGVLFYFAIKDKIFVIYGDKGIDELVASDFWNSTRDLMVVHFKNKNFKQGLIDGILKAGEQLKKYFPALENNINELSDEISKG